MFVGNVRRIIRGGLVGHFLRLLKTDEVRHYMSRLRPQHEEIRRRFAAYSDPYRPGQYKQSMAPQKAIFVTGRFRSGSTLLWNIFRNLEGYTAYYEPFNERRWFDQEQRGDHTDGTHRGVSEYWSEYGGLSVLGRHYSEDWIRHNLYMDEDAFDLPMKAYTDTLIMAAKGRSVLQFNRTDFRLGWLRANYPDASIVHIYRNPRDQWCSVLQDINVYPHNAIGAKGFPDHFYLNVWCRDLCCQFPFLTDYAGHHQYYLFYLLWKLSYCFGRHYADISVGMEELTDEPKKTVKAILDAVGSTESSQAGEADLSFIKPSVSRWKEYAAESWFQPIEDECEAVIKEFLIAEPIK